MIRQLYDFYKLDYDLFKFPIPKTLIKAGFESIKSELESWDSFVTLSNKINTSKYNKYKWQLRFKEHEIRPMLSIKVVRNWNEIPLHKTSQPKTKKKPF